MEKLIIFADFGLDDAAAAVSIFKNIHRFSRVDIVPIGGNVPVEMAHKNCITLLSHFTDILDKIRVIDTRDLPQPSEYLAEIHGRDGMGDIFAPAVTRVTELTFKAWQTTLKGDEIILSLGPATLVKKLLEKRPHPLILMGGLVKETPNFKGYEFNEALDTDSFFYCLKFPHTAITLDTCRVKALDIRGTDLMGDDIHTKILKADQLLSVTRKEEGCFVWDDVAACYLLHPERFETKTLPDSYGNKITTAFYISHKPYFEY